MVKFTEEDKKWLEAHNAEKVSYYKRKEFYIILLNKNIFIIIETNIGSDYYMVTINLKYMSKIEAFDKNMISAVKLAINDLKHRFKQITFNVGVFDNFQI